ncbi:MAG: AbrB/MazE/SpoVT family DNA-binding domain-containing protein [Solirubrobacterales bacterium]
MRITSKGQVTIPKQIRDQAGFVPGSEVDFAIEEGKVTLHALPSRGAQVVDHLRGHRSEFAMTTEEIMALTRGEG